MAHPNETLVREAFEAFGRGDLDTMQKQYWTEDIRFHVLGRGPLAGDFDGSAAVLEWLGRLAEATGGTYRAEALHDVLANDERAVALYTARAERNGRAYQDETVLVMRIQDGKIAEQWSYVADQYGTEEFLS
jgi:ketosteroid isomerase-like protein